MRSFITLLKREWLEGRATYVIAPAVVLGLIILTALVGTVADVRISAETSFEADKLQNGEGTTFDGLQALIAMGLDVAGSTDQELRSQMAGYRQMITTPFALVLMIVTFFALIAAIYDERKDRSVLFWKSMPTSDLHTVASKYVGIAWIAPLATILAIWVAQLFATAYMSFYVEDGFAGRVWSASGLLLSPIQLLLAYLIQGLWAMPIYAWVLLVSAWANKAPIMWALLTPIVAIYLEQIFFDSGTLRNAIGEHLRLRALPKSDGPVITVGDQLATFADPSLWLGLIVGIGLLAATVYYRRRYNEI